ncbi:MAG: hypothetical protein OSA95_09370, partial [Opitutales bacterium]|nr:hypothetical protein [Opitutales bacterium]
SRVELPAGGGYMRKPLLNGNGLHEPVTFRMGKRFIDVVKSHVPALLLVVMIDRLQTGNIAQEGGSGEAAKHDHRMSTLEFLPQRETLTPLIKNADLRDQAANLGHILASSTPALTTLPCGNGLEHKRN